MTTVDSTMNNSPVDTKRESAVVWTYDSRPTATADSTVSKASHQQKTSDHSDEINTSPSNQVAKTSSEALPILKALKLSLERGMSIKHNDGTQPASQTVSQSRDESQHSQNGLQTNGALHDEKQSNKEPELHTNDREYHDSKDAEQSKQDAPSRQDSGYDASHTSGDRFSRENGRPLRSASHYSPPRSDGISRRRPSHDRDSSKESRHTLREADTYRPGVDTHRPVSDTYRSDRPAHRSMNNQTEAGNTISLVEKLPYVANSVNQGHNDVSRPARTSDYRGQSVPTQDYRRVSLDQARGTRYSPYSGQVLHRAHDNGANNYSSSASRDRPYIASASRDQPPSPSLPLPPRASADYRGYERPSEYRKSTEIEHTRYHDAYAAQRDYRERDYYATTRPNMPLYEYNRRSEDVRYHERYPPAATVASTGYHDRPADPYVVDQPSRGYSYPERRVDSGYERRDYPADYSREASDRYEGRAYTGSWNHQAGDHRRDYRDTPSQSASAYSDRRYDYGPYDTRAPPTPLTPAGYDTRYQSRYDYR